MISAGLQKLEVKAKRGEMHIELHISLEKLGAMLWYLSGAQSIAGICTLKSTGIPVAMGHPKVAETDPVPGVTNSDPSLDAPIKMEKRKRKKEKGKSQLYSSMP
jgi:hypothetical protein